ncbi:helix-turn-helix transcriptional regulator [Streptomyces sp. BPTC-684]|uniref:helix-turn-helix domain-containing protein n=1 Tax=Streptomyces sp. BPTC-684 TaxID=3043734 RepID=UPI0024B2487B|nr:helix-turn-helix transcriptional regulator [Streptomyces sp. BPTC-684]WHM38847.1 helix-turn-helix transcriptional regulator [Streptomyces sp. BPTC-684]
MSDELEPQAMNPLQVFGRDLAKLREARGITMKALGLAVGYSESYVSKVEAGKVKPSPRFVEGCDRVFGTGGMIGRSFERMVDGVSPSWFAPFLTLEPQAAKIRGYATTFLTGLVQTPAYANAAFRGAHPHEAPEHIAARVEERMKRRKILERPLPPLVWLVVHEAALRMIVGSSTVMAGQLEYLVALAEVPHVTVQVYPFQAAVPASGLPFTLLSMGGDTTYHYAESAGRGHITDAVEDVRHWTAVFERLCAEAEPPARSVRLIAKIIEEYRT